MQHASGAKHVEVYEDITLQIFHLSTQEELVEWPTRPHHRHLKNIDEDLTLSKLLADYNFVEAFILVILLRLLLILQKPILIIFFLNFFIIVGILLVLLDVLFDIVLLFLF